MLQGNGGGGGGGRVCLEVEGWSERMTACRFWR